MAGAVIRGTAAAGASKRGSPPVISISDPVYDFGEVPEGTKIVRRFRVRNLGGRELRLEKVKTSCQCTAAVLGTRSVPPGGAGEIEIRFDTTYEVGRRTRTATIYSNDPDHPTVNVALTGRVTAPVTVEPRRLYLGRVRRAEGVTKDLTVRFDTPGRAEVVGVRTGLSALSARVAGRDSSHWLVRVRLRPGTPPGRLNDTLRIFTTVPGQAIVEVPVFASVEGDLVVTPPQVDFGLVRLPAGPLPVREVWVRNQGKAALHLTVAESVPDSVRTKVEVVRPGRLYRLRVRLEPPVAPGPLSGHVRIECNDPDEPQLTVPIVGVIEGPAAGS